MTELGSEKKEIWTNAASQNLSKYDISTTGRIKAVSTNRMLNTKPDEYGYMKRKLVTDNKEIKHFALHRLVAQIYVPNPDPKTKKTVHHIDGNPSNNKVENLMWADMKEQNNAKSEEKKCKKKKKEIFQLPLDLSIAYKYETAEHASGYTKLPIDEIINACTTEKPFAGFLWKYCKRYGLPWETCRPVTINGLEGLYWATSIGRIFSVKKNELQFGHLMKSKYRKISAIDHKGNTRPVLVHRMVTSAYYGNSELYVDHIDFNKQNNVPENLRYVTPQENAQYTIDQGRGNSNTDTRWRSVVQFDLKGNKIAEFKSILEAAGDNKSKITSIGKCCGNKRLTAYNFIWRYANDISSIDEIIKKIEAYKLKTAKIIQLSLDEVEIRKWNTLKEIADTLRTCKDEIRKVIKGKKDSHGGFKWKREELVL